MTPALVFKEGPLAGRRVEVVGELVIGRVDAGLTIDDEEVSRRHAVVRPGDGEIEIEDLGSRNGTYVNGVRIDAVDAARRRRLRQARHERAPGRLGSRGRNGRSRRARRSGRSTSACRAAGSRRPCSRTLGPCRRVRRLRSANVGKRSRGIASRQLGPQLVSFAVVIATAVALILYFADH